MATSGGLNENGSHSIPNENGSQQGGSDVRRGSEWIPHGGLSEVLVAGGLHPLKGFD